MLRSTSLARLLAEQHGVCTRAQARELGIDRKAVARRLATGDLVALGPQLLRAAASPLTDRTALVASVLEVGPPAAIGYCSSAHRWQLPGFLLRPVEVLTLTRWRVRPTVYAHVHTTRVLPEHHVLLLDGIRTTTPTRTLFDLAGTQPEGRVARALDHAWSLRLTDGPRIAAMLEEIRRSGRGGVAMMERLLDERGLDWTPGETNLERRFHELIRRDGQPPFRIQVTVGDDSAIGRVDAVDDDVPLVVEIQSDRFHCSPTDRSADLERHRRLQAAGYQVLPVWDHEVWHAPGPMLARVRAARRRF